MSNRLGKYLTFVLRHKPDHIGVILSKEGWVDLDLLVKNSNEVEDFKIEKEKVIEEVAKDEKGRFELSEDRKQIRCVQGHSVSHVEPDLTLVSDVSLIPKVIVHGTKESLYSKIMEDGLLKMERKYVHLIEDVNVAIQNGKRWREKKVILIYVDLVKMLNDGEKIYLSKNKVWLVDYVSPKYFTEIVEI